MESAEAAPPGSSSGSQPSETSPPQDKGEDDQAPKKAAVRKRTKTGCLTCRKRRIKCDEARPTCGNCIKSKRQCEGYNQRVIFKDPLGAFSPFGPLVYPQPSSQALVREQQLSAAQQKSSSQNLQIIAPKPPPAGYFAPAAASFSPTLQDQSGLVTSPLSGPSPDFYSTQNAATSSKYTFFPPETTEGLAQDQWKQQNPKQAGQQFDFSQLQSRDDESLPQNVSPPAPQQFHSLELSEDDFQDNAEAQQDLEAHADDWEYPDYDDDASMGESEEDYGEASTGARESELGMIVSRNLQNRYDSFGIQPRTFAYHADRVLATYEPGPGNSPLNDKKLASVFWHFVNVTAPSISMFERRPFDGLSYFHGPQIKSRQHIWTYVFPILSLSHPGLLQAILAIGSLQIARLQQVPPTASLKHYHLSLRRIARNVGRPSKRTQPSNLAAILLLAFYQVWNSDHGKWCKHLVGAHWIIRDIPFLEMTRAVMDVKRRLRQEREQTRQQQPSYDQFGFEQGPTSVFGVFDTFESQPESMYGANEQLTGDWDDINVPFLRTITGKHITYDELGLVPPEDSSFPRTHNFFTDKDVDTYENLSDLFWWYCKMDAYQSVLGGTRLFMNYDRWTQCPPRAPIGRLNAVYGTYDHLILLLGRLTNFQSRDLVRKRRAFRAKGTFGPTGAPPGIFPGMMPASDKVAMPMGFSPPQDEASPQSDSQEDQELEALTAAAYREWDGIKNAFEAFAAQLGVDFEPLDQDLHPISISPFGPAIRYRTYGIAGIWANYYMGLIVLHRCHPEMAPAAMVAAGMSAQNTMGTALKIARIAHGLEENLSALQEVSTLVSAAFIECSFCLFVSGIQYQAADQRRWLIDYLLDVTRLTGWASARQIADGCESAWSRAGAAGRGPPYTRRCDMPDTARPRELVWSLRRIDARIQSSDGPVVIPKEEKAHYALGLLGVQEDLERLDLDTADPEVKESRKR